MKSNWWLPIALGVVVMLGHWVEGGGKFLGITWDPFWARIAILLGINFTLAVSLQLINGIAGQFSLGHAGFMAVGAYLGGYAVATHGNKEVDGDPAAWLHPGGVLLYLTALVTMSVAAMGVLFALFKLVNLLRYAHKWIPAAVLWGAIAWLAMDVFVKNPDAPSPLGAIAFLGTLSGWVTGTYEWIMTHGTGPADRLTGWLPENWVKPACFIISLLGGGVMAALVGFVVGLPTLRLKGDYLAIATLGVSELIATAITNSAPLGRATGLSVPPYAVTADPEHGVGPTFIFPWVYAVALLATLLVWRIQHSPKGRALQCLREDEVASGAVGIDVTSHKVLAFVIGAGLAGVAGSLFAHYDGYLNPKQFNLQRSIEIVVIVTLGGLGSIPGTLIACLLLTLLQPTLQTASQWMPAWTPRFMLSAAEKANEFRLVIYSVLLIIAMLVRSKGWLSFGSRRGRGSAVGGGA